MAINPHKPGRPSHTYHSYVIGEFRLILEAEVQAGNQHASKHSAPGLGALLARIGREAWPCLLLDDCDGIALPVQATADPQAADRTGDD